jgi:hypothetical protein
VLPSADNGDLAFVPFLGGPKRPITILESGSRISSDPTITLDALVTHKGPEGRPPPEPPTEDSHHQVTIARPEGSPAPSVAAPVVHEEEPAVELAVTPPSPAPEVPEGAAISTNLSPTVVVRSQERSQVGYITRTDLAEIQVMIEEAVRRALREHVAAQAASASTTTATMTSTREAEPRGRVAAAGAGLLLGGTLADVFVLNWDVWVRGDAVNAVGWLQQMGLMGTAALAGAGAAFVAIAVSRGRRRLSRKRLMATRVRTTG